jgi:hypothetical protein
MSFDALHCPIPPPSLNWYWQQERERIVLNRTLEMTLKVTVRHPITRHCAVLYKSNIKPTRTSHLLNRLARPTRPRVLPRLTLKFRKRAPFMLPPFPKVFIVLCAMTLIAKVMVESLAHG